MNLYIYSDESGVFDKAHNNYFVFGGIICIDNNEKEMLSRKYSSIENNLRKNKNNNKNIEIKAFNITNEEKSKLFRSLNNFNKFGIIVKQEKVHDKIFESKKDKQRFLDYVYKVGVKKALEDLIKKGVINSTNVKRIYFFVDEHTTATNGKYELKEALEQEFKSGTFNSDYSEYNHPVFDNIEIVELEYCNSASKLLVRTADIISNKVYYLVKNNKIHELENKDKMFITYIP